MKAEERILQELARVGRQMDVLAEQMGLLINALAEDDEEGPQMDLSGNPIPPRDKGATTF